MSPAPERIVVIDDEKRMCESLEALLQGNGYKVSSFQNSQAALEDLKKNKTDLVITDIKMPAMDGMEILRQVKIIDESVPVILMTGYAALETAVEAIAAGAYDYLLKPVEFTQLELAVKRALEKRRTEINQLRLMEELKLSNLIQQRRIGELNALYEAGKSIGSSANISELLRQIVVLATTVTEAQIGSIMLFNETGEYLTIEAAIGLSDDIIGKTRLLVGSSIAGYVAERGEALIVTDVENDDRFKRINNERYGAASLLCAPLKIKNEVLGVINMANKQGGEPFSEDDLRLLSTFASQAAVAVDDAYQFEKSRRRLAEIEVLHEFQGELHRISSMTEFRTALVDKLRRIFPIDYAIWFDVDRERRILVPDSALGDVTLPLSDSGRINIKLIDSVTISLDGLDLDSDFTTEHSPLSDFVADNMKRIEQFPTPEYAYMSVPIFQNGEISHIYYLGSSASKPYSSEDYSLARLVINQAALLFERERSLLNATRLLTMGNMISEISHDLRKPLTSIRGSLQLFRERNREITESSELYVTAEEEVHRMNDMVRELVNFSNPNKYQTTRLDLTQIIGRAAELTRPEMDKHSVAFESSFSESNWDALVNKNQMLEVFLNLFLNAIEAMPDGGKLSVVGSVEKPEHKNEKFLTIKVKDSGVGMSRKEVGRIFERYYTTKDTGTGLGLVVVERIISAHSGTLNVQSVEGKGTTFIVYLPILN